MFIEKMNFAITCCTGLLRTSNNYTSVSLHSKALLRVYFQHSRKDLPIKAYSRAVFNQFSPGRCKKIVCRFFKFGVTASASITAVGFAQNWSLVELCPDVQCHSVSKKENFDDNIFYGFPWSQFFWEYLLPECTRLGVAVVCALIGAALNMYIPVALGDLINALNDHVGTTDGGSYFSALKMPVLHLLSAYLLQGLTTFAYISLLSNVGENVAYRLRRDLYRNFLHQDVSFYDAHKTGELVERLTSDVQDFKSSFKLCVSQGLKSVTQTVGCVTALYVTSPTMTLALCGTMPLLIALGSLMGMTLRRVSKTAQQHASDSTAKAIEVLANFRTVRAFANEDIEVARYDDIICRLCHVNQMLGIGIGCFQGLTNIALNGIIVSVIGAGGYLVSTGELNAGQLMSFLVSAQMIQRSLSSLSVLFGTAVRGVAAGSRVFDSLNTQPTVLTTGGRKIPYHSLLGHLRFEDVRFTYPTRPNHEVLCGVNLDIRPCQTVAVCGLSGAGKSTVANLVERFYDVSSGRITLDGADIRSLDASWLRGRAIGYIDQDPVLFSGTIAENIRYGKSTAGDDEVERVSRLANAHNFITSFPLGYLTMVGEHGAALSGGQKQRIAIARALLKDPAILILDEATSALDAESEGLVQAALERVMRDRTVLVIAHRLSTIRNADVIAVMRGGKVVETGTHEQLRRKPHGLYRELIKLQESGPDVVLSDDVLG